MLLDELLIKVGIEADSSALKQLEAFLNQVGQGAEQAVSQFNDFVDSVSDLKDSANTMSPNDALQAWVGKLLEMDEVFAAFGGTVEDRAQGITDALLEMGLGSEEVEQVFAALNARLADTTEEIQTTTSHTEALNQSTEQSSDKLKENTEQAKKNTEALAENQEETESLTGSLMELIATKLGIDGLGEAFERFGGNIEKANLSVGKITLGLAAAIGAAVGGLTAFVSSQMEALDSVRQLANVTGEAADAIYSLGLVAEVNGSSAQAAESSIANLSRTIGEAATGIGRGAKTFEQYGLSAKNANGQIKSSIEMMGELSDKMQKMSNQEQIAMLAKLGIDESMIQTLRMGSEELEEALKARQALTLGVGSEENASIAADFNDAMTDLAQILKGMGEFLALRLAPTITDLIGGFKDWYVENNELVKGVLEGFGKFLNAILWFIEAIDNVVSHTLGWKMAIYAIGAALLWVNRQMMLAFATNPITWIVAAIVGLILLIDDFITYLQGGETLLGDFWEPFAQGVDWVVEKIQWFKKMWQENFYEVLLAGGLTLALFGRQFGTILGFLTRLSGISHLAAAFGKIIAVGGRLLALIRTVGTAIRLAFMANPVGLMISAVALLAYGVYQLIKNWDSVKKAIIDFANNAFSYVKEKWETFKGSFDVTSFETLFSTVLDIITTPFELAFKAVVALWQMFTGQQINLDGISGVFDKVKELIIDKLKAAFDWVISLWNKVIGTIGGEPINIEANVKTNYSGPSVTDALSQNIAMAGNFANASQLAKAGATSTTNHSQVDNRVVNHNTHATINIHESKNAKVTGSEAARAIQNTGSSLAQ